MYNHKLALGFLVSCLLLLTMLQLSYPKDNPSVLGVATTCVLNPNYTFAGYDVCKNGSGILPSYTRMTFYCDKDGQPAFKGSVGDSVTCTDKDTLYRQAVNYCSLNCPSTNPTPITTYPTPTPAYATPAPTTVPPISNQCTLVYSNPIKSTDCPFDTARLTSYLCSNGMSGNYSADSCVSYDQLRAFATYECQRRCGVNYPTPTPAYATPTPYYPTPTPQSSQVGYVNCTDAINLYNRSCSVVSGSGAPYGYVNCDSFKNFVYITSRCQSSNPILLTPTPAPLPTVSKPPSGNITITGRVADNCFPGAQKVELGLMNPNYGVFNRYTSSLLTLDGGVTGFSRSFRLYALKESIDGYRLELTMDQSGSLAYSIDSSISINSVSHPSFSFSPSSMAYFSTPNSGYVDIYYACRLNSPTGIPIPIPTLAFTTPTPVPTKTLAPSLRKLLGL